MRLLFRPRVWFFLVALCCAGLLAFAFYVQYALFEEPCPLCILQRVAVMWIGLVALVASIHNPGRTGRFLYAALLAWGQRKTILKKIDKGMSKYGIDRIYLLRIKGRKFVELEQ